MAAIALAAGAARGSQWAEPPYRPGELHMAPGWPDNGFAPEAADRPVEFWPPAAEPLDAPPPRPFLPWTEEPPPADAWRPPAAEPLPRPLEGVPTEIDWSRATEVDLSRSGSAAADEAPPFGDFFYRGAGRIASGGWLLGTGDRLGFFSLAVLDDMSASLGGLQYDVGAVVHFISGPHRTDLPPRVYDFTVAFPRRGWLTDDWWYDVTVRVGWFSDFEGSARDAIRFPGHAVVYHRTSDQLQWVLGIDYLDRDDISLLPVIGALWMPTEDWRVEAVFPKPRIARRRFSESWLYLGLELGGGTWDIERAGGAEDRFTYRDLRLALGLHHSGERRKHFLEIGWAFERRLEYRSGTPDYHPPGTLMLRSLIEY